MVPKLSGQELQNSLSFPPVMLSIPLTDMVFHKFSISLTLFSLIVLAVGCNSQNNKAVPTNPFAQNLRTVPPPATFSSQESYLGQTPGGFIPQTPATTFPSAASVSSAQSETSPTHSPSSDAEDSNEKATVFAHSEQETDWTPAAVATTSQTAFQAMEAKTSSAYSPGIGTPAGESETLIVGASHTVTTIADDLPSALNEPIGQIGTIDRTSAIRP